MTILIVSCSLHPLSRSYVLGLAAAEEIEALGAKADLVDLREHVLPLCDAVSGRDIPLVAELKQRVEAASAILVAAPVYNYDLNAAAKNFMEWTGRSWTDKLVGFLCVAGGRSSYMSVLAFGNSLMIDFRCLIIPRFVYATGEDFTDDRTDQMALRTGNIRDRVAQLAARTVQLAKALDGVVPA